MALIAAVATPIAAGFFQGFDQVETWNVAAASLAVLAAVVAGWTGLRVLELHEDAQLPNPIVTFDLSNRRGLAMLRVKNAGGSPAHRIKLTWDVPVKNEDGTQIDFGDSITVLSPGESIPKIVDVHHAFVKSHPGSPYAGTITFEDSSGRSYSRSFLLDGRPYFGSPSYAEEAPETLWKLQQIPELLNKLRASIDKLANRP